MFIIARVRIQDQELDVDVRLELEEFTWENARWSQDKLIAPSPFRYDRKPSFFCNLTGEYAGTWSDSGYYDPEWKSGGFVKLLSFLRNETYEETIDYLRLKYDYDYNAVESINIEFPTLNKRPKYVVLPEDRFADKQTEYTYLKGRGIHPKIIELQGVFDAGNAIGIPWRNANGEILNVKYRLKRGKTFWYEKGATPVNRIVYGLDTVINRGITKVVVCEAEIDAMTWQSIGVYAIAVGGVSMNSYQADLIVASGVKDVILGGDNDKAGKRFNERVGDLLRYSTNLYDIDYRSFNGMKDANEIGPKRLKDVEYRRRGLDVRL